jgi:hypothetical protein
MKGRNHDNEEAEVGRGRPHRVGEEPQDGPDHAPPRDTRRQDPRRPAFQVVGRDEKGLKLDRDPGHDVEAGDEGLPVRWRQAREGSEEEGGRCARLRAAEGRMNPITANLAAIARRRLMLIHAVPEERAPEHIRNALQILRFSIEHDEPLIGNGCPAVAVPITSLARIQARLECVLEQLEPAVAGARCIACRGTILSPTVGGVPRGSCHCQPRPA